jgi:hypothetical protein
VNMVGRGGNEPVAEERGHRGGATNTPLALSARSVLSKKIH